MSSAIEISHLLGEHYGRAFAMYGATPEGVDWGPDAADHLLRLDRMLAVLELGEKQETPPTFLDVGCGYGSLLDLIHERELSLAYTGIDICPQMVEFAKSKYINYEWLVGDLLSMDNGRRFDYLICNGVLTQKLSASIHDMDLFLRVFVSKMFDLCNIGIAFNVMTTHVNFMAPNLYYRNPIELLGWCMTALTPKVRLDHAYPMYEYTVYLYREDAPGLIYGAHRDQIK
jgi:SAM-dependent methyltransferase